MSNEVEIIIKQYLENEYINTEEKLKLLFFEGKANFKEAVYKNNIEDFLKKDRNQIKDILKIQKNQIPNYSRYPVLHVMVGPLFKLLIDKSLIIWGGINFWDRLKKDFYAEQFINEKIKNSENIPKAMQWLLSYEGKKYILPLTTFVFEKLPSSPSIILFSKLNVKNEKFDFKRKVSIIKTKNVKSNKNAIINLTIFNVKFSPCIKNLKKDELEKFKNLFKVFELVTPKEWNYLYYITSPLKPQAKVAGILLVTEKKLNNILINFLRLILGRIISYYEFAVSLYQIELHALRSAVASIMSRNMSHIHGSHIEPGLQHKISTFGDEIINRLKGV